MGVGIYALWWETASMIYIGQSIDLVKRKNYHINLMRRGIHINCKIQEQYDLYGLPEFNVLEHCRPELLNTLEIMYVNEFNSINDGLNICEAGTSGFGTNCSSSKYSRIQILKVFSLLYNTTSTYKDISDKTKVTIEVVNSIAQEHTHKWLCSAYPSKYAQMINNRAIRRSFNGSGISSDRYGSIYLKNKSGYIYLVHNVTEFCKNNTELKSMYLASAKGISRLLTGFHKTYKGWELSNEQDFKRQTLEAHC